MARTALILVLLLLALSAAAENLLYHENLDGDLTDYEITIRDNDVTREYTLVKTHDGCDLTRERILIDPEGNTLEWEFTDFDKDIRIEATREGRRICLTKETRKKSEREHYTIENNDPWHQLFPFGMEDFVTAGESERAFWFIQPQNLKLSSLRAVRGPEKLLTVHGTRQRAVEVEITINNWLSRFWKGLYFLRPRDGRYLFYEGVLRRNLTRGTVELVNEAR